MLEYIIGGALVGLAIYAGLTILQFCWLGLAVLFSKMRGTL